MIIKKPAPGDIPGLRQLWQQAFGDTDDLLDKFFRVGFSFDRSLCISADGDVAAALYWFDCAWGSKKVAYIYAVATAASHRGKGLCRRLMEETHRHLAECGYAGAVLVPGDPSLTGMYEKFGYRCFCPVQKATSAEILNAETISPEEYGGLRQACLGERAVLHSITALKFLDTYGNFYKTENGAFCGYWENESFHFEEILGHLPPQQEVFSEAMYLSLDNTASLPEYFAIPLN